MRCLSLFIALPLVACSSAGAHLYQTQPKAPSLDAGAIEALDTLGAQLVDKGANFSVYSEHAERIELLLFDDPESQRPTRQFPLERFGDVWNLYVEGVGLGQHYGFIAWGPNWPYDPKFTPGTITGFKADVDADGNRFNPNKLLFDPYSRALHRDHDWSKGSTATGPNRTQCDYAAASKSVIVKSQYTWSDHEAQYREARKNPDTVGHQWNSSIVYELHPKGFTANPSSGVDHPGTFRGLGEKASYLADLGITVVHIMPVMEKPLEGGYWGYNTIGFFVPERSYSFRADQQEAIDEFKWMVDQLHQRDIEVMLDVVYNHTGEGGFWRELLERNVNPDPSINSGTLVPFDPKETVGLYSFRGFDNQAYYGLTADNQAFWNNTGVGNETRANHRPFRRLIIDSLRYWATEFHVDGFRFDLAPVLGERDQKYYAWDNPVNTVLQDIADDPVLQQHNTRLVAEPWASGNYDTSQSYNGPPTVNFGNGGFTRIGLFPSSTTAPGTGWGEWNGRFRDWWRAFQNFDSWTLSSTEVKDGGFFLMGSYDWYNWNGRNPWHSYNFVTVHDGFTMYDVFSYAKQQNGCSPLNQVCCTSPTSAWCEKASGESNNRSANWGAAEGTKRALMRNLYTAMMVSHGTPLLYSGDEWMRTQLGNNNAWSNGADNAWNWMDWGTFIASDERHRMHDFVKQVIRFRKEHAWALAPSDYATAAQPLWRSAQNTDQVNGAGKSLMLVYSEATHGQLAILINGEPSDVEFTLPTGSWKLIIDTQEYNDLASTITTKGLPARSSNNIFLDAPIAVTQATWGVKSRSMIVLEASP